MFDFAFRFVFGVIAIIMCIVTIIALPRYVKAIWTMGTEGWGKGYEESEDQE